MNGFTGGKKREKSKFHRRIGIYFENCFLETFGFWKFSVDFFSIESRTFNYMKVSGNNLNSIDIKFRFTAGETVLISAILKVNNAMKFKMFQSKLREGDFYNMVTIV